MSTKKFKKFIILGESNKGGLLEGKGGPREIGSCMYCDEVVWVTKLGYTSADPGKDIELPDLPDAKDLKPLHKMCLIELMEVGYEAATAITANLKIRDKN